MHAHVWVEYERLVHHHLGVQPSVPRDQSAQLPEVDVRLVHPVGQKAAAGQQRELRELPLGTSGVMATAALAETVRMGIIVATL